MKLTQALKKAKGILGTGNGHRKGMKNVLVRISCLSLIILNIGGCIMLCLAMNGHFI